MSGSSFEVFNAPPKHTRLPGTPGREINFEDKAQNLTNFSSRAAKTARMVAAGTTGGNKKMAEALLASAGQVFELYKGGIFRWQVIFSPNRIVRLMVDVV